MGCATDRNHYLLELARALRRFSGEAKPREASGETFIEYFLRAAGEKEAGRRTIPALARHVDMSV